MQTIPISKRCNGIYDCEDGTDEDNCTCKDNLANIYPVGVCDGFVDCDDGSDEENCSEFCYYFRKKFFIFFEKISSFA